MGPRTRRRQIAQAFTLGDSPTRSLGPGRGELEAALLRSELARGGRAAGHPAARSAPAPSAQGTRDAAPRARVGVEARGRPSMTTNATSSGPAPVRLHATGGLDDAVAAAQLVSTAVSSMRCPRIFTCDVGTTQVSNSPFEELAHQVAGPVDAAEGRMLDELLERQVQAAEVSHAPGLSPAMHSSPTCRPAAPKISVQRVHARLPRSPSRWSRWWRGVPRTGDRHSVGP